MSEKSDKSVGKKRLLSKSDHGTIDSKSNEGQSRNFALFSTFFFIEVLGALMIGLCIVWGHYYLGGYSTSITEQIFNYHPLLMIIGMIYLNSNGVLVYRITRCLGYECQKLVHFIVQFTALVVSLVGLYAIFYHHMKKGLPNLTSPHSWMGITAVSSFAMSLIFAFFALLYPGINPKYKQMLLPVHKLCGTVTLVLTTAVAVGGLTEKALLSLETKSKDMVPEGAVLCSLIITIVLFIVLVMWLLIKSEFKRGLNLGNKGPEHKLK